MAAADLVILSDRIVRRGRVGPGAIAIRDGRILAVTDGPYPGPARTVVGLHFLAFVCLMLQRLVTVVAHSP